MTESMQPYEHINRAEVLIRTFDGYFDQDGTYKGSTFFTVTPPVLTLAQAHLQLAHMKMMGGQRR